MMAVAPLVALVVRLVRFEADIARVGDRRGRRRSCRCAAPAPGSSPSACCRATGRSPGHRGRLRRTAGRSTRMRRNGRAASSGAEDEALMKSTSPGSLQRQVDPVAGRIAGVAGGHGVGEGFADADSRFAGGDAGDREIGPHARLRRRYCRPEQTLRGQRRGSASSPPRVLRLSKSNKAVLASRNARSASDQRRRRHHGRRSSLRPGARRRGRHRERQDRLDRPGR